MNKKLRDDVVNWLDENDACDKACEWVEAFSPDTTLDVIWHRMNSIEWLVWLLYNTGLNIWDVDQFLLEVAVKYCPSIKRLKRYKALMDGDRYDSEEPPVDDIRNRFLHAVHYRFTEMYIGIRLTDLADTIRKREEIIADLKAHPHFQKLMEEV